MDFFIFLGGVVLVLVTASVTYALTYFKLMYDEPTVSVEHRKSLDAEQRLRLAIARDRIDTASRELARGDHPELEALRVECDALYNRISLLLLATERSHD